MKEGAWIRVIDGQWWWIDEHSNWMKRRENAMKVGLPDNVWKTIKDIPNDYGGDNRKRIVLAVMSAGFVRMRGHGDVVVFEFTAEWIAALLACRSVLAKIAGEFTRCRFNNLTTNESLELHYGEYAKHVEADIERILLRKEPTWNA